MFESVKVLPIMRSEQIFIDACLMTSNFIVRKMKGIKGEGLDWLLMTGHYWANKSTKGTGAGLQSHDWEISGERNLLTLRF